jgi:hypothetical protein
MKKKEDRYLDRDRERYDRLRAAMAADYGLYERRAAAMRTASASTSPYDRYAADPRYADYARDAYMASSASRSAASMDYYARAAAYPASAAALTSSTSRYLCNLVDARNMGYGWTRG